MLHMIEYTVSEWKNCTIQTSNIVKIIVFCFRSSEIMEGRKIDLGITDEKKKKFKLNTVLSAYQK